MRAGSYARYSTDKQRETSTDDQHRANRARADQEGWQIAAEYSDQAITGEIPVAQRAGGKALLADVLAGRIDAILLESLDRISRDMVEQETLVRRLEHRGIRIIGLCDGYDTANHSATRKIQRAMRGLVNEIYLDDLRAKVHRGLTGQVERSYYAGGLPFGYRSIPVDIDAAGEPRGHRLEVVPEQAAIVLEIHTRYAAGESCQRIVSDLNRRGVRGPRGGTWAVSAIYGSKSKGTGIVNNELYTGRYIWNRSQWLKDPDTKRRQRVERPRSEWLVDDRPQLAIVPVEVWAQVRARVNRPRANGPVGRGRPVKSLLGGLLRCGLCGGSMVAVNAKLYGCTARKDRGASVCTGLLVQRKTLELRLITQAREGILSPQALTFIQERIRERAQAARAGNGKTMAERNRRLTVLEREIATLVDALVKVGFSEAIRARLVAAEGEQAALRARRAAPDGRTPVPDIAARYRAMLANLQGALDRDIPTARTALQELLGPVRIVPGEGSSLWAEMTPQAERLLIAAGSDVVSKSVAGVRFLDLEIVRLRVR